MPANEDLDILSQFFAWAGDIFDDEEKGNLTKEIMSRRGHKPVMNWADDDGQGKKSNSNVLGLKSRSSGSGGGFGNRYTG